MIRGSSCLPAVERYFPKLLSKAFTCLIFACFDDPKQLFPAFLYTRLSSFRAFDLTLCFSEAQLPGSFQSSSNTSRPTPAIEPLFWLLAPLIALCTPQRVYYPPGALFLCVRPQASFSFQHPPKLVWLFQDSTSSFISLPLSLWVPKLYFTRLVSTHSYAAPTVPFFLIQVAVLYEC